MTAPGTDTGLWCGRCYRVSHHPADAANAYCGACNVWLDDGEFAVWSVPRQCADCTGTSTDRRVLADIAARLVHVRYAPCWHRAALHLCVTRAHLPAADAWQ